ncbi:MAG: dihydrolipoyl dehydrogenase [Kiritimatiellae bacterium]|jgi:dihydrolipoamide dehydrogenase|nr:dihydrolipoyl dehydrogenase [Kiritimatiellia bacterium]
MEKFDIVVIGAGPGGYPAAIHAAQLGKKVAIVEKEKFGGTCLNWGCIPTKALIATAEKFAEISHAAEYGIKVDKVSFDYAKVVSRKDEVVAKLNSGVGALLKGNGVTAYSGTASLISRNVVEISGKEKVKIEADKIILATGSESFIPGFIPKSPSIIESKAFLAMTKLPKSMIVLGGGVIGCELACMAAMFGVEVTVVEMLEDILMILDKDVRSAIRSNMEKMEIKVLTGAAMTDISATTKTVKGKVGETEVKAEKMLVSIGRRPYTTGVKLENAGIELDELGYVPVDEFCRTKASNIFCVGDANGGPQLAHAATAQAVRVVDNICKKERKAMEVLIPACIFTAPEVGVVGLTEQDAKEQGINVKVGKFSCAGLGKAMASGETEGFVKWISDPDTDQLLGAVAVGAHATDLIAEAAVAIRNELTVDEIGNTVHAHPTFAESWMEAAHSVHNLCVHSVVRRKR